MRPLLLRLGLLSISAVALLAVACGGDDDGGDEATNSAAVTATRETVEATITLTPSGEASAPASTTPFPNPPGNLLVNPGFEEGADPWITLDPDAGFEVSDRAGFSGSHSALLQLNEPAGTTGAKVIYLVQELNPPQMPELLRGAYRVENWQKGSAKQYLQVVVIAFAPDNFPPDAANYQMRYILAGIQNEPLDIGNAHYAFFSQDDPQTDRWLIFETNVREDFAEAWGSIPEGYDKLRVLFEVRYDDKLSVDGASRADVYYDDLYFGSAQ